MTAPVLAAGLTFAAVKGGAPGFCDSAVACVMLALPYVLLFIFAGGGAGDAKMMGAVGAWLGVVNGLAALAAVSLCAIVLAVSIAVGKKRMTQVLTNLGLMTAEALMWLSGHRSRAPKPEAPVEPDEKLKMPYGLAIFAGTVIAAAGVMIWRT